MPELARRSGATNAWWASTESFGVKLKVRTLPTRRYGNARQVFRPTSDSYSANWTPSHPVFRRHKHEGVAGRRGAQTRRLVRESQFTSEFEKLPSCLDPHGLPVPTSEPFPFPKQRGQSAKRVTVGPSASRSGAPVRIRPPLRCFASRQAQQVRAVPTGSHRGRRLTGKI